LLKKIHQERTRIGNKQQPLFASDLDQLNSALAAHNMQHPFELDNSARLHLCSCCYSYANGAKHNGLSTNFKEAYLYRYTSLASLTRYPSWNTNLIDIDNAFIELEEKVKKGDWYNLGNIISGFYKNRRGFSWWTNVYPDTIEKLYALGLPFDWINEESVIMRINIDEHLKNVINIPSVIDGYDSPIFLPQQIDHKSAGKTLNLNNNKTFSDGFDEYVLDEIDVNHIEIVPVLFEPNDTKIMLEDLIIDLSEFYTTI